MQAIFESIREACSKSVWSRGVELVREKAVTREGTSGEGLTFRVSTRGGMVSPQAILYVEDEDWECTCRSHDDPCEHVAAAVIALRQAHTSGKALPEAGVTKGRIRYLFVVDRQELRLEREIVNAAGAQKLTGTLDAIAKGRIRGPAFVATPSDVEIERLLGPRRMGALPRNSLHKILAHLADLVTTGAEV